MTRRELLRAISFLPGAALVGGCSGKNPLPTPVTPVVEGDGPLTPGVAYDLPTITTLANLQRHTEWVSRPAAEVPGLLEAAGYALVDGLLDPDHTGGQAYVAARGPDVVVSFRGSGGDTDYQTFLNILTDADVVRRAPRELVAEPGEAEVHAGFYDNYLRFRDELHRRLAIAGGANVFVTGFSLGSALACFCAFDLRVNLGLAPTAHMLGTPRTGNLAWKQLWESRVGPALRVTLESDPVPRVPLHIDDKVGFDHLSGLLGLNFDGTAVPLDQIDGQLKDAHKEQETFKAHDRDRYGDAIDAFLADFVAVDGTDPFAHMAAAETASVRRR